MCEFKLTWLRLLWDDIVTRVFVTDNYKTNLRDTLVEICEYAGTSEVFSESHHVHLQERMQFRSRQRSSEKTHLLRHETYRHARSELGTAIVLFHCSHLKQVKTEKIRLDIVEHSLM